MNEAANNLRLLAGNANPELAKEISEHLGIPLVDAQVGHFNNGEIQVMISESVRGKDIFIIQPTCQPVNENLMELLIMTDACKRASAKSVTAVVPYYAYARQDRKTRGREPISAKLVANLMSAAGLNRVVTVDLHAGQIQGFFDIPVDHLAAAPALAEYFQSLNLENVVVVSPDLGGVTRARNMADLLGTSIAIVEKRRPRPGCAEVMNLIGDVKGKTCIMIDDMVDTAGSLCEGAKDVYACCSHGILTDPATQRIQDSCIKQLVITNTIPVDPKKKCDKIISISLAPMLADFIKCIYENQPVSNLFNKNWGK